MKNKNKITAGAISATLVILLTPYFSGWPVHIPGQPLIIILALLSGFPLLLWLIYGKASTPLHLKLSSFDLLAGIAFGWLFIRATGQDIDCWMWLNWTGLLVWYMILRHIPDGSRRRILEIFPFIVILQVVYSLIHQTEAIDGGIAWEAIKGSFRNTALWGGFLSITIIISVGQLLYYQENRWYKIARIIFLAGATFLLLVTDSRGAWLCALGGITLLVWWRWPARSGKWKWVAAIICILSVVFFCEWLYHYKIDSADGRLLIWSNCLEMIREKTLGGWGIDGVRRYYMLFQENYFHIHPDSAYAGLAGNNFYAFNETLRIGVEQGLPGLFFLLACIWEIGKAAVAKDAERSIAKASLCGFFIFAQFSYPLSNWQLSLLFLLMSALLIPPSAKTFSIRLPRNGTWVCVAITGMAVIGISLIAGNAYRKWDKTFTGNTSDRTKALEIMESIHEELKWHPFFLQSYGRKLNEDGQYAKACFILQEASQYYSTYPALVELGKSYAGSGKNNKAICCWRRAANMVPGRFTPLYLQMKVYENNGDHAKAYLLAEEIIAKKRKTDSPELYMILREAWKIYGNPRNRIFQGIK